MNRHLRRYIDLLSRTRPQLTDVSLRDGIQSATLCAFPTKKKTDLLFSIMTMGYVSRVEVGSLVSNKVLPIMADTMDVYRFGVENATDSEPKQLGVLVPNMDNLKTALEHKIPYVSMITSVSDEFQQKNTRKTILETKQELQLMCYTVRSTLPTTYLKLYISCINKCPIMGTIENNAIVNELLCYSSGFEFDELCLSDTCGTLTAHDFKYIVSRATMYGVSVDKLSVHLHVLPGNELEVQKILFYCFEKGIYKFDVSLLETGGCSVTMGKNVKPNLSHVMFHRILNMYIRSKIVE